MARTKIEELTKPDFFTTALDTVSSYVRDNLRTCIIGASAVVVIALAIAGYMVYEARRSDNIQYNLTQALNAFQNFSATGNEEALAQAKDLFSKVAKENLKETGHIADLYLARIATLQGKQAEADKVYDRLARESSNSVIKALAGAPQQPPPSGTGSKNTKP